MPSLETLCKQNGGIVYHQDGDVHCKFDCGEATSGPCDGNPGAQCWKPGKECMDKCHNYNKQHCPHGFTGYCAGTQGADKKLYLDAHCDSPFPGGLPGGSK